MTSSQLTPKYAAEGFYFNYDETDIMAYAKKLASNLMPQDSGDASNEMISFVTKMSTLPSNQKEIVFQMSAKNYWNSIGRKKFPSLFKIAEPILEMISSSAAAERTWSAFRFIHSRLRNLLTNERVDKLIFIYINCVMLDDKDKTDYIMEEGAVLNGTECE